MPSEKEVPFSPLPPPKPSDYIGRAANWPESRYSTLRNVRPPSTNFSPTLDSILGVYWHSRETGMSPQQLNNGERIPRVEKGEGMVKLVVDTYHRSEIRSGLKFMQFRTGFAGRTVSENEFNETADTMVTDPWYEGSSIRILRRSTEGGWSRLEDIRREVAYVVAARNDSYWFIGFFSKAMRRHPGSLVPPNHFLRLLDAEVYGLSVGEISAQDKVGAIDGLTFRTKVATAFVYPQV